VGFHCFKFTFTCKLIITITVGPQFQNFIKYRNGYFTVTRHAFLMPNPPYSIDRQPTLPMSKLSTHKLYWTDNALFFSMTRLYTQS
jgi:hypothetical protein